MFQRSETMVFENFCQKIIERPRPIGEQPHVVVEGFIWCEDWLMIEISKYFFNGREMYIGDPPPNRLKNNPLFDKQAIIKEAEDLLARFKTPEAIVEHLTLERERPYHA